MKRKGKADLGELAKPSWWAAASWWCLGMMRVPHADRSLLSRSTVQEHAKYNTKWTGYTPEPET
jgi:hypothetical protein